MSNVSKGTVKIVLAAVAVLLVAVFCAQPAHAEVCNLKVVTDASPDYTDMQSMIRSITAKWPDTKDKCWAMFYWVHIGRRQTSPMILHGVEVSDPIRQFNDYGYAMCSTVSGINTAIWNAMGLKIKFWDIGNHTVSECLYDDKWHIYDDSMSALYTLCDGKTIAGVTDVGAEGSCNLSGGKKERFHVAKYHCLTATSTPNGFLTGSDCNRSLDSEGNCFRPNVLQYRYYECGWDQGYRYALNLKPGEEYTRYYSRLDVPQVDSSGKAVQGKFMHAITHQPLESSDCYTPNYGEHPEQPPFDPERGFNIRGNGEWIFHPNLTAGEYNKVIYSESNIAAVKPAGLQAAKAGTAEVVFPIQSANVTTSMWINAKVFRKSADDVVKFSFITNDARDWQEIKPTSDRSTEGGESDVSLKLPASINGAYQTLIKITLQGKAAEDAVLRDIQIRTITQVNAKTQPKLNIGKNTIYIGAGDQTETVTCWPNIGQDKYKDLVVDEKNIVTTTPSGSGWINYGHVHSKDPKDEAYIVYRISAPNDFTKLTYGGRFSNRYQNESIDMSYSFDEGKTWTKSWTLTSADQPWDTLHSEVVDKVPAGTKSILAKYTLHGRGNSIHSIFMEGNYKVRDTQFKPMEVTFRWAEKQEDYSVVERSHTVLVEKLPLRYTINVGGADHPVMRSLTMNMVGSSASTQPAKYGYSDGKDAGGEKFVGKWQTVGKVLTVGKKYKLSAPSSKAFGASDDANGTLLTDGMVGGFEVGGLVPRDGISWSDKEGSPDITVDLEKAEKLGAFRIHLTAGWPAPDALMGQFKDKIEVLTSADGEKFASQGFFNLNMRFKDVAWNYMLPDIERLQGYNFELILPKPVEACYVKYKVTPSAGHNMVITEVQALDFIKYEPFDMRLALPDENVDVVRAKTGK